MNVPANIGLAVLATAALVATAFASPPSSPSSRKAQAPYAGQETRAVSSLSAEEIEGLLAGQGLGLAKPAELNGFPGPIHALDLAGDLRLNDEQKQAIRAAYERMNAKARELGAKYIEAERNVDEAFRSGAKAGVIAERVAAAERLRSELRLAHLTAHLETAPLLSAEQKQRYAQLRGYTGAASTPHTMHHHHKH